MATKDRKEDDSNGGENSKADSSPSTGIETARRLHVAGLTFESNDSAVNSVITLSIEGNAPQELTNEDIDNIVRLLASQQRRRSREGAPPDGRGRVLNPETDSRLKPNR